MSGCGTNGRNRPDNIQVIGVGGGPDGDGQGGGQSDGDSQPKVREVQGVFAFPNLDEWKDAIYAKMVMKVGERAYWETWARDIARIAETHVTRIKALLDDPTSRQSQEFDTFLQGLQTNLNPAVSREDAIEMLAQHQITKPVFDALFANYVFTEKNPVSQSMQRMLDILHEHSLEKETATLATTVRTYNYNLERYTQACSGLAKSKWPDVESVIESDPTKISWTRSLKSDIKKCKALSINDGEYREAMYRPFTRRLIFFSRRLNEMILLTPRLFPTPKHENIAICVSGSGSRAEFSVCITNLLPDLSYADKSSGSQCFPLYLYEKADDSGKLDLGEDDGEIIDGYRRRDAITDAILKTFREAYGNDVTKEDIFYYVYGVLHSPEYRTRFAADLKKMLPRIPLTQETTDFRAFSTAGRELAKWHLNYETVEPWPLAEHMDRFDFDSWEQFQVQKMTFARPTPEQKAAGMKWDKTKILYNSHVTISQIPLEAYDYVVNGKPAIEWVMERYQVTRDKDSGIVNDPNDWCREHNQPRYGRLRQRLSDDNVRRSRQWKTCKRKYGNHQNNSWPRATEYHNASAEKLNEVDEELATHLV